MLNRHFQIQQSGSTLRTEMIAGLTTFITAAYILVLNPQIMSAPYAGTDPSMAGKIYNGVFIGTCLAAFLGTMLVSLMANSPLVQAPGMGLNAFFAYTVVLGMGYTYNQALVIVFLSGLLFILITKIGLREAIIRSIPECVKKAITPGIGLFITIIGLKNSGLVVGNAATLVSLLDFSTWRNDPASLHAIAGALVALFGLLLTVILSVKNVRGSIFLSIIACTLIGIPFGVTNLQNFSFTITDKLRDFMEVSFFHLDFAGLFAGQNWIHALFTIVMLVISFSLVNLFDSIGTLLGAGRQSGLMDENGDMIHMKEALMADAISTAAGALLGTSTVATVSESSAGIAAGGRTGMTSMVTALLFLGSVVFAPLVGMIPSAATAPALIFVGVLMLGSIQDVDFSDLREAVPSFCTIVFMPFTYSIANGIALGLMTYCIISAFTGRAKQVKGLTWIAALVFVLRYALMTI